MISPLARSVCLSCKVLTMNNDYFAKEHEALVLCTGGLECCILCEVESVIFKCYLDDWQGLNC